MVVGALIADSRTGTVREMAVEPLEVAYPEVQPLADGGLLVVDARVVYGSPPNARVIAPDRRVRRAIMFGDGVEHVLVDRLDRAWVGYLDEGVFGNLGWGVPGPEPIGSPGLLRFDLRTATSSGRSDRPRAVTTSPIATP